MSSDGCEEGTEASTCRPDGTAGRAGPGRGRGGRGALESLNQQHVFSSSGIPGQGSIHTPQRGGFCECDGEGVVLLLPPSSPWLSPGRG